MRGGPYLIGDYRHHEEKVDSKRPEDDELRAVEVATGYGVLLGFDELIVFERSEHPGLVGS